MSNSNSSSGSFGGCGLVGFLLAGFLSYSTFGKVGWALLAALFNWLYVIYFAIRYGLPIDKLF